MDTFIFVKSHHMVHILVEMDTSGELLTDSLVLPEIMRLSNKNELQLLQYQP